MESNSITTCRYQETFRETSEDNSSLNLSVRRSIKSHHSSPLSSVRTNLSPKQGSPSIRTITSHSGTPDLRYSLHLGQTYLMGSGGRQIKKDSNSLVTWKMDNDSASNNSSKVSMESSLSYSKSMGTTNTATTKREAFSAPHKSTDKYFPSSLVDRNPKNEMAMAVVLRSSKSLPLLINHGSSTGSKVSASIKATDVLLQELEIDKTTACGNGACGKQQTKKSYMTTAV